MRSTTFYTEFVVRDLVPARAASLRSDLTTGINNDKRLNNMIKQLLAFMRDEEGLTMVEYAVAGGLITAAAAAAFRILGTDVTAVITKIDTYLH